MTTPQPTRRVIRRTAGKQVNLVFGALFNSPPHGRAPDAKAVILGPPSQVRPDWAGGGPGLEVFRFGIFNGLVEPLGERYPRRNFDKKQAGSRSADWRSGCREKECKVISEELASFKIENLRYWDLVPGRMTVIISIDPANSEEKTADDNA